MLVKKQMFVFLVHVTALCMGSTRPDWPDYFYYSELQGWLKVHDDQVDWSTARANCHKESALLAGPWTTTFTSGITRIQSSNYPSYPVLFASQGIRTGLSGIQMEPCGNKRCPVFLATGTTDKVTCNQTLPYACFVPSCGDSYEYEFNSRTGQCYKFHVDEKLYQAGENTCRAEGGYMALISDPIEKEVLLGMVNSLTYIGNEGGLNRRHLDKAFTGGYSDYECDTTHRYICEKSSLSYGTGYDYRD